MLTCVASAAPAFTTKVPEEPEKVIYLHYITKSKEGILDLFQQRSIGWTTLQPAEEQHEAEVSGEILTCLHVYAHVCYLVSVPPKNPCREKARGKSL